ncbi:DHS-like NAD/FAD-binding domain-containing protein [Morchella snyderi]|nr:DHS-like NAD/FAD-binding domain-containing protein [Morchella snyderi]
MGAELSHETTVSDDVAPVVLTHRTVKAVAEFISSGNCKKVVFMVGAGISTSAGIPDFRTPGTGLYSNLQRLNLPHPEAVFDISFFRENPVPFYTLARELYPGNFKPTVTHAFIRLVADKGLLLKCFTQNIDTLERAAGVSADKMVEAHGSFASQRCIDCKAPYSDFDMRHHINSGTIPRCPCGGLVKPDITFFGEALPSTFHDNIHLAEEADLAIVMGSSLSVYPFAALPGKCSDRCARVLINMESAGGIGSRRDDVLMLGTCDNGVRRLAKELGWDVELEKLWDSIRGSEEPPKVRTDEMIEEEVRRLTEEVERELRVAEEYKGRVEEKLKTEDEKRRGKEELRAKVEEDLEGKVPKSEERAGDAATELENEMPRLSLNGKI